MTFSMRELVLKILQESKSVVHIDINDSSDDFRKAIEHLKGRVEYELMGLKSLKCFLKK